MSLSREQLNTFVLDWENAGESAYEGAFAVAASHVPVLVEDRKLVLRIDQHAQGLNEREVEFVADMVKKVERGSIMTGPQRAWAERIDRERVR